MHSSAYHAAIPGQTQLTINPSIPAPPTPGHTNLTSDPSSPVFSNNRPCRASGIRKIPSHEEGSLRPKQPGFSQPAGGSPSSS